MSRSDRQTCSVDLETLIDVWRVLETLTVSLDRIGSYEVFHGEAAAKEELHRYIGPKLFRRIANARHKLVIMMEQCEPSIAERLERLAETEIEYWNGPDDEA